ncbi:MULTISPECIES: hypothetical protein [Saccharothrix]|uniref:hypothetical protein n=1 Tax=Saccharothrix TaxID=2071 RepID=UPI00093FEBE7|nr:hypothetical protein [Saccharothrix sp. CB00851]OKI36363.1 hypothetical protein A6A25_21680 [Saccharothrix sp. CB00851]
MLTGRLVLGLCLALVGATAVACSPHAPFAIRLNDSGAVEIIDTRCEKRAVDRIEVIAPDGEGLLDDRDPRLWRIDFESPSTARTYVVGEVPPGAEEVVEWREPEPGRRLYLEVAWDRITTGTGFSLEDLAEGKVRYHLKNMTHEEFLTASRC